MVNTIAVALIVVEICNHRHKSIMPAQNM